MDTLLRDVRQAVRFLARSPGFAVTALTALALGIGANTAVFSVVDKVLLRPLPFRESERIVVLINTSPGGTFPGGSPTRFNLFAEETAVFDHVSAYRFGVTNLTGGDSPEQVVSAQVSHEFFALFGARTLEGRVFTAAEDQPNGGRPAVISEAFRRRRYAGTQVVGRTIDLGGEAYEIVGVLDSTFSGDPFDPSPDVFLPYQIDPHSTEQAIFFTVAARLKPGVTVRGANARMPAVAAEYERRFPDGLGPGGGFAVETMQALTVKNVRTALLVIAGAVALVLLIACANVANLLLARATARKREFAIRAAIGARRGRLIRQLLTESAVLSLAGGGLGLLIGLAGIKALLAVNPGGIPRIGQTGQAIVVDARVLLFTGAVSLATGMLFGLVPALQASKADLNIALKDGGDRGSTSAWQKAMRSSLVVIEVALALTLLVAAGLLIRTFIALRSVDPGFDPHQVLTMRMSLTEPQFSTTAGVDRLSRSGLERVRAMPGIMAAATGCCLPLEGGYELPFVIVGRPLDGSATGNDGGWVTVSPGYFDVFRIALLKGRDFTDRDDRSAPGVVIVNQTMARKFWPGGDPLADRLLIGRGLSAAFDEPARQIIGIVADVRDGSLSQEPQPTMYVPQAQLNDAVTKLNSRIAPLEWLVRTGPAPYAMRAGIQDALRQTTGLPVARVRSMEEVVARSTATSEFSMRLLAAFGVAALLLAAIGVYGLMAYSVEQRTTEIGIRLALGADTSVVRAMVVRQGMILAGAGILCGLAASFAASRLLTGLLFGVTARDPLAFAVIASLLAAVSFAAVWIPATRATRVDPLRALRAE